MNRFVRDERGATAVEYALMIGLLFLAIVVAIGAVANANGGSFNSTADDIAGAMN